MERSCPPWESMYAGNFASGICGGGSCSKSSTSHPPSPTHGDGAVGKSSIVEPGVIPLFSPVKYQHVLFTPCATLSLNLETLPSPITCPNELSFVSPLAIPASRAWTRSLCLLSMLDHRRFQFERLYDVLPYLHVHRKDCLKFGCGVADCAIVVNFSFHRCYEVLN